MEPKHIFNPGPAPVLPRTIQSIDVGLTHIPRAKVRAFMDNATRPDLLHNDTCGASSRVSESMCVCVNDKRRDPKKFQKGTVTSLRNKPGHNLVRVYQYLSTGSIPFQEAASIWANNGVGILHSLSYHCAASQVLYLLPTWILH